MSFTPLAIRSFIVGTVAAVAALSVTPRADAQQVPVFLIESAPGDAAIGAPAVNRVAVSVGADAVAGGALARELSQHYGSSASSGDALASVRERIRVARQMWNTAANAGDNPALERALDSLDAAARDLEAMPEAFDAHAENLASLQQALVFLAERSDAAGASTRAADAMRRLARVDPSIAFTARAASPAVQRHYADAVAALPRGAISVDSAPPGCTVIRDGRPVGAAPVELQDLAQGRHRIQVQCGGTRSLVHPIDVVARTRTTLVIDAQLDGAVSTEGPTPALRYPSIDLARPRLASDLALLGRALGARRAYGVIASEDRVVVVDVGASALVGESPVTDGSRLRALLSQPVAVTPVLASGGARNNSNDSNGTVSNARPSITMRRGGGVPVGAVVIGVLGAGVLGVGVYGTIATASAQNRAAQSDDALVRMQATQDQRSWQIVEIAGYAVGGVALVASVLVGVLTRGNEEVTTVRAMAGPVPGGGGWAGVGGVF